MFYREQVGALHEALQDDTEATWLKAGEVLRSLVKEIILTPEAGELKIDVRGDFAGIAGRTALVCASSQVATPRPHMTLSPGARGGLAAAMKGLSLEVARDNAMKPRAYFINVGRGETVDEAALIEALEQRRIAGAGLDVFAAEPLPTTSPLWQMTQVFIAPHIGNLFEEYAQMAMPLIIRNMRAFLSGQTDQMINKIDRSSPATAETQPGA